MPYNQSSKKKIKKHYIRESWSGKSSHFHVELQDVYILKPKIEQSSGFRDHGIQIHKKGEKAWELFYFSGCGPRILLKQLIDLFLHLNIISIQKKQLPRQLANTQRVNSSQFFSGKKSDRRFPPCWHLRPQPLSRAWAHPANVVKVHWSWYFQVKNLRFF